MRPRRSFLRPVGRDTLIRSMMRSNAVAKLCSRNQRRKLRVKDMRFQRLNNEYVVQRIRFLQLVQFFLRRRIAGIDQVIQLRQGLMQIITVTNGGGFFPDGIRHVAQTFQRIPLHISLCFHGCVAKLRTGLNEQHEQHTVHIAHALNRQFSGIDGIFIQIASLTMGKVIKDLVTEKFDALAQSILQVLRYAGRMSMRVFIQLIQKAAALGRAKIVLMQKNRHRLQGALLMPGEDVRKVKTEVALFIPFVTVDQCDLMQANENQPARRLVHCKEYFCCQLLVVEFRRKSRHDVLFITDRRGNSVPVQNSGFILCVLGKNYP